MAICHEGKPDGGGFAPHLRWRVLLRLSWKVGLLLHGQNSKQRLVAVLKRCRETAKLSQPSGDRSRQGGACRTHIRARLRGQQAKQQLVDVPERRREGYELCQPNGDRHNKSAKGVAHPSAVARTRTKTATGGCAKEASERQRTRSVEQHQNARKSAQRRCTAVRSCTDKNQNSNWRMCQRCVGKAMNSVSQEASECGKSAQRRRTSVRSCTNKNQNSNWRMCQRIVGKATNSVGRTASERGKSAKGVAHQSAVARTRTKIATGGCAKEASGRQRTRSAEQHQNARQGSAETNVHPCAVARTRTKTATGRCTEGRRDGNEVGQPSSIRTRKVSAK